MPDLIQHFPPDFIWGTSTAAHQVEGDNVNNDWWEWEQRQDGGVFENHSSGKAADWWGGRFTEDIRRMAELGTTGHRLSIEWSRIEPKQGEFDEAALKRYREILTAMRDAGITPMVTLHHFSNPMWFVELGGWADPGAPARFLPFVERSVSYLADLCDLWCTINEPNVYGAKGYFEGTWPPGVAHIPTYFKVVRNLLDAHARAYHAIHAIQPRARVGLAKHMIYWGSRSGSPLDQWVTSTLDHAFNGVTLDALKTGEYRPLMGKREVIEGLAGAQDYVGLNYYSRYDAFFNLAKLGQLGIDYDVRPGAKRGPGGWGELYHEGVFLLIKRLSNQFNLPIYITENGVPDEDDQVRPGYMLQSLQWVWKACMHNYPVKGYFWWSLIDNFEWAEGYDPRFRFGLYALNFETQERSLRKSGELYGEIARGNALSSALAEKYAPEIAATLYPGEAP